LLPLSPIAPALGFVAPSAAPYGVIALVVIVYRVVLDVTKTLVFDDLKARRVRG